MEISEEDLVRIQEKIEKLKQSKFKQQMLPAWRPVPSFGSTMIIFGIFGLIFLTLGITLYVMSERIQGMVEQYDGCGVPVPIDGTKQQDMKELNGCEKEINIGSTIKAPIYVYYQLDNFYQNHRRYVKSRSNLQLMGNDLPLDQLDDCDPIKSNKDLGILISVNGSQLDPDEPAYPCGLVAKSYFNDTFELYKQNSGSGAFEAIDIDDSNIAWESDRDYKFKNLNKPNWKDIQWQDVEDQHFIVWMRTAGLPNFRKLYGEIKDDLTPGKYKLEIINNYDVSSFAGSKYFVLSTTNVLGGQNYFLAICYIIVGALCIMFGIIFFIAYMGRKQTGQNSGNNASQPIRN